MSRAVHIQLKAALLLITFSLNALIGFACSIDINMGFNKSHHHEEATEIHIHKDGSKHHHPKKEHDHSQEQDKDNCCSDKVVKISQEDKTILPTFKLVNPVFFTAFIVTYYNNTSYFSQVSTSSKYFVRGHHPPIPDIRIAIQSFQI